MPGYGLTGVTTRPPEKPPGKKTKKKSKYKVCDYCGQPNERKLIRCEYCGAQLYES